MRNKVELIPHWCNGCVDEVWNVEDIPAELTDINLFHGMRQLATYIGMPMHEVDSLIAWRPKPLTDLEEDIYYSAIKLVADQGYQRQNTNKATDEQVQHLMDLYVKYHIHEESEVLMAKKESGEQVINPTAHLQKVADRALWQIMELCTFLLFCLKSVGEYLQEHPIKIPSGKYDESLRAERTQQDLNNEMAQELTNLASRTAYAKIISNQTVATHKVNTLALPDTDPTDIEEHALKNAHVFGKLRSEIEAEIRQRQARWTGGSEPPRQSRQRG